MRVTRIAMPSYFQVTLWRGGFVVSLIDVRSPRASARARAFKNVLSPHVGVAPRNDSSRGYNCARDGHARRLSVRRGTHARSIDRSSFNRPVALFTSRNPKFEISRRIGSPARFDSSFLLRARSHTASRYDNKWVLTRYGHRQ